MLFRQLFDPSTSTYTYLIGSDGEAAIIDPVRRHLQRDLTLLSELGLELRFILDTHVHADHITGSGALRAATGATVGVSAKADVPAADRALDHNEQLSLGSLTIECRQTPGHTSGCMTFVVGNDQPVLACTGDALLIRGCGRTDFQQGDAGALFDSVRSHIFTLPEETLIYPGHDYQGLTVTTVGEEKHHNKRLKETIDKDTFVRLMGDLNLAPPARIAEAVPANLNCGESADAPQALVQNIAPAAVDELGAFRIVDVRSPAEFSGPLGHLDAAECVPLGTIPAAVSSWSRRDKLLVVCRGGRRSLAACEELIGLGFEDVTNLEGGMEAWRSTRGHA